MKYVKDFAEITFYLVGSILAFMVLMKKWTSSPRGAAGSRPSCQIKHTGDGAKQDAKVHRLHSSLGFSDVLKAVCESRRMPSTDERQLMKYPGRKTGVWLCTTDKIQKTGSRRNRLL